MLLLALATSLSLGSLQASVPPASVAGRPQDAPAVRGERARAPRPAGSPARDAGRDEVGPARLTLDDRVERDRRVSFTARAAERARDVLEPNPFLRALPLEPPSTETQGAALLALGAGRRPGDAPLLESHAVDGPLFLRRAATLALGDLGAAGLPVLARLGAEHADEIEHALVLSVLRIDVAGYTPPRTLVDPSVRSPRALLEAWAERDDGSLLARAAHDALAFDEGAADLSWYEDRPTLVLYYDTRWAAAKRFGFVDGRRWRDLLFDELLADEDFLDRFVVAGVRELDPALAAGHVLQMMSGEDERIGVLRGIATAMPSVLESMFENGAWRPRSPEAWLAVLEEFGEHLGQPRSEAFLSAAFDAGPEVRTAAGLALLRAGYEPNKAWMASEATSLDLQLALCDSAGDRKDPALLPALQKLASLATDPRVAVVVDVAAMRLGHAPATARIRELIASGPGARRATAILALGRVAYDASLRPVLEAVLALPDLSPNERLSIELGLARAGTAHDRVLLREWLRGDASPKQLRRPVIRALAKGARGEDMDALAEAFPFERDDGANAELALALLSSRDSSAVRVLRKALWDDDLDRSLLAGGIFTARLGARSLIVEVEQPPAMTGIADARRVGFALGQWGGIPAVETLSAGRGERDPVLQGALLGALAARGEAKMPVGLGR